MRRATENATPEVKICVSPARNVCWEFFLASRCSAVAIFVHLVVTPRESTDLDTRCVSGGKNLRFACAGPQKMHLGSSKFAFRLRETLGRTVFPAQGHTKRVSGAQNLRFACAKRSRGSRPVCFPCAGPHKTRLRRSKFAFRLRRATKSDDKDAIRHESETWILQKLLRYISGC